MPDITRENAALLLLEACPSFLPKWEEYLREWGEERLLYIEYGLFAHHLIDLYQRGDIERFPAIFSVVERLHRDGDPYVKEAATIGLLEDIQNLAGHWDNLEPEAFLPFLQPETRRWWDSLNRFWSGESKFADGA